jgi:hypothetical protein
MDYFFIVGLSEDLKLYFECLKTSVMVFYQNLFLRIKHCQRHEKTKQSEYIFWLSDTSLSPKIFFLIKIIITCKSIVSSWNNLNLCKTGHQAGLSKLPEIFLFFRARIFRQNCWPRTDWSRCCGRRSRSCCRSREGGQ